MHPVWAWHLFGLAHSPPSCAAGPTATLCARADYDSNPSYSVAPCDYCTYTLKSGETMLSIAVKLNITDSAQRNAIDLAKYVGSLFSLNVGLDQWLANISKEFSDTDVINHPRLYLQHCLMPPPAPLSACMRAGAGRHRWGGVWRGVYV